MKFNMDKIFSPIPDSSEINFTSKTSSLKRKTSEFEKYFQVYLEELEKIELQKQKEREITSYLIKNFDELSKVFSFFKTPLDSSSCETISDLFLSKAFEFDKLSEGIENQGLKQIFKEIALFLGVESEKIRQGFYS